MNYYFEILGDLDFYGRARRKEYWIFTLINSTIGLIVAFISGMAVERFHTLTGYMPYLLFVLFTFIPSLAVSVRRLHDIDKSGWWIFIGFVPILGAFILLKFHLTEGDSGENQYGEDPKKYDIIEDEDNTGKKTVTINSSFIIKVLKSLLYGFITLFIIEYIGGVVYAGDGYIKTPFGISEGYYTKYNDFPNYLLGTLKDIKYGLLFSVIYMLIIHFKSKFKIKIK